MKVCPDGIIYIDCHSIYGHHTFEVDSRNDSLNCLQISHYPLENSNQALRIERNFYGDTLGIGLTIEVKEKVKFWVLKRPLFKKTYITYYDKIGQWFYYDPEGKLIKKEKY